MEAIPFSQSYINSLITGSADLKATIYLPTSRNDDDLRQAPIRLKNFVSSIELRLEERGTSIAKVEELTAPLRSLVGDERFWSELHRPGLALFVRTDGVRCFGLHVAPQPGLWIGAHPYILPLLANAEGNDPYRLLAVSANAVTLYAGSRDGLRPIKVDSLPADLVDALRLQKPPALIQVMNTPVGATFHGQGGEVDRRKGELHDYFRIIDRALHPYLAEMNLPLVFAGVEYLFPIYRDVNTYPHLLSSCVTGNPEQLGTVELHHRAETALESSRRTRLERDTTAFEDSVGAQRSAELFADVLTAAHEGAVECLFVASDRSVWGRYEAEIDRLAMTYPDDPSGEELLNLAAVQTLRHRGRVYSMPGVEVPHKLVAAALLRYARPTAVER